MTEHLCHDFIALRRSLTTKRMSELRAISTRAEVSPTRFWNECQWGNLEAEDRARTKLEKLVEASGSDDDATLTSTHTISPAATSRPV